MSKEEFPSRSDDLHWLLQELDRVWFHDNALTFHVGDWLRSHHLKDNSQQLPVLDRRSSEMKELLTTPPPRLLRETGKVFSTGDLNISDEATPGGATSPDTVSEQGLEDLLENEELRKLETIPSASTLVPFTPPPKPIHETTVTVCAVTTPPLPRRRRRKLRRKQTRSLSELEFDELRGFRDLGFKLTQEDLTPRVVGLVQPHGFKAVKAAGGDKRGSLSSKVEKERIYPSHAWSIRRPDSPLLNLRLPDPNGEGVDMKAHLKFWAQTVASTVRQEC